ALSSPPSFIMLLPLPISTLSPYTTLFRSLLRDHGGGDADVLQVNAVRWGPKPVLMACRDPLHEARVIAEFLRISARDTRLPLGRSEEHTSELQSRENLVGRLLLEKKKTPQ